MCLLLPNHDGGFEMDVKDNKEFMITRLEKQVLDVGEEDICDEWA